MKHIIFILGFGICLPAVSLPPLEAQTVRRDYSWSAHDPVNAMVSRIYAQAEMIRAQNEAEKDFAAARQLHAQARSQEIDNWEKAIRKHWELKLYTKKKRLEVNQARQVEKLEYLNNQKWKYSRLWERLKNHPELSTSRIKSGEAHNFLLDRLAVSALPYDYDDIETRYGPEALHDLRLDEDWLGDITLSQDGFKFPADQEVQDQIDNWPYLLRWQQFNSARAKYEAARQQAIQEANETDKVAVDSIQKLKTALMELTRAFHFSSETWEWAKAHRRYTQHNDARRFLAELDREIRRLEETGDIRPFQGRSGYDPAIHGEHVVSLLTFMNRNGIEFASARPGEEYAYNNLYVMMRALYLTVADEDESIQPEDLSRRIDAE